MPTCRPWRAPSIRAAGVSGTRASSLSSASSCATLPTAKDWQRSNLDRLDQRGDGAFQAAQIFRSRQAMVAVLHKRQLDIVARDEIDKFERVLPRHVFVARALQDAHCLLYTSDAADDLTRV